MSRPSLALLAVLALIGACVGVTEALGPPPSRVAPTVDSAALVTATRVCPRVREVPGAVSTGVSVAATGLPGQTGVGTLSAGPVGTASLPPTGLTTADTVLGDVAGSFGDDSAVLIGQGALAAGLTVEQVTRGDSGLDRGIATVRCTSPGADSWFVGAATTVDADAQLVLVNPDATMAAADLELVGAEGALNVPDASGILVSPHSRRILPLAQLAPDQPLLAVHLQASTGRLAGAIEQTRGSASNPGGLDWLPTAGPPARQLVIPGIPAGAGARSLVVTNPTGTATTVAVRLTTGDGQFVPTGLDALPLQAQHSRAIDLTPVINGVAAAVTVTSEAANVVAALSMDAVANGEPLADFAWAGPTRALAGPALLPEVMTNQDTDETLYLTAPDRAATVTVQPLPVAGQSALLPAATVVNVPAARTVAVPLGKLGGNRGRQPVKIVNQTPRAAVYAGRLLVEHGSRGPLVGWLPVLTEPTTASVPPVRADPLAGTTSR